MTVYSLAAHRGHFYNCENGHTFVIGDVRKHRVDSPKSRELTGPLQCGGATMTARCPECNALIGGSDHQLHQSNTRAMEFEEIARQTGSQDAPWAWGRGA